LIFIHVFLVGVIIFLFLIYRKMQQNDTDHFHIEIGVKLGG